MPDFWSRNSAVFEAASKYAAFNHYLIKPEMQETECDSQKIARYFHGITHGCRTAFSTILFINLFRKYENDSLKEGSRSLTDRETVLACIYAIFHDTGRKSDRGSDDSQWEADSFENYKKFLLKEGQEFLGPITSEEITRTFGKIKGYVGNADCLEVLRTTASVGNPFLIDRLGFYNCFKSNAQAVQDIQIIISIYRRFLEITDCIYGTYLSKIENKQLFESIDCFSKMLYLLKESKDPNIIVLRELFDLVESKEARFFQVHERLLQYRGEDVYGRILSAILNCDFYTKIVGGPLIIDAQGQHTHFVHELECIFSPEGKKVSVSMTGFGNRLYGFEGADRYFVGYAVILGKNKLTGFYPANMKSGPTRYGFNELHSQEEKTRAHSQVAEHLKSSYGYDSSNECFATITAQDITAIVYFAGKDLCQNIKNKLHAIYAQKTAASKGKVLPILEYSQNAFLPILFNPSKDEILQLWKDFVIKGYRDFYIKTHKSYKEYFYEKYKQLIDNSDPTWEIPNIIRDAIIPEEKDLIITKEQTLETRDLKLTEKNIYQLAIMFNNAIIANNQPISLEILRVGETLTDEATGNTLFHLNIFNNTDWFLVNIFPKITFSHFKNLLKENKEGKTAIDIMIESGTFSYKENASKISILGNIMPYLVAESGVVFSKNYVQSTLETAVKCKKLEAVNTIIDYLKDHGCISLINIANLKKVAENTRDQEIMTAISLIAKSFKPSLWERFL